MNILNKALNFCKNKTAIVCRDFNDKFNISNDESKILCDFLSSYKLEPCVDFLSRRKYRLDNIFTNTKELPIMTIEKLVVPFSDHDVNLGQFYSLSVCYKKEVNSPVLKTIQPLTNKCKFIMFNILSDIEWNFLLDNVNSINEKFDKFNTH